MNGNNNKNTNQKPSQGKKKQKNQNSISTSSRATSTKKHVKLGQCTHDYARALANPFTGPMACVPVHPAQFSRKIRTYAKGAFDVQSLNGIGWIASFPESFVTNDTTGVWTSVATGVGLGWFDYATVGNRANFLPNSDYPTASIGTGENQFQYRVVGSGLRIRYIGTELNRSGQIIGLQDANHLTLLDRTLGSLDTEEVSKRFPVSRNWVTVLYRPVDNDDFEFRAQLPPQAIAVTDHAFYMGFAILAPAGISTPYEFEAFTELEVFGKNIRGMSPSHTDPVGFGAVHAVSAMGNNLRPTSDPPLSVERRMVKDTAKYIADHTSAVSTVAEAVAGTLKATKHVAEATSSAIEAGELAWDIGSSILDFLF